VPLASHNAEATSIADHQTLKRVVVVIDVDTRKLLSMMILQASTVVAAVVDEANTSSIVPESKLCRSSSFLAMPPPPPLHSHKQDSLSSDDRRAGDEMVSRAVARSNSKLKMHGLDVVVGSKNTAADGAGLDDIPPIVVSPDLRGRNVADLADQHPPGIDLDYVAADATAGSSAASSITEDTVATGSHQQQYHHDLLSDLSPDQCAVIVDCVFGCPPPTPDENQGFDPAQPAAKRLKTGSA